MAEIAVAVAVATTVGGAFLSAVLPKLFDRLTSKHVEDFIRGRDIEKEFERLKKTWTGIEGYLNDADNKQYKNVAVKEWLDDLKDAAHDAEDVIDEVATEALRMKLESELSSQTISNQAKSNSFLACLSGCSPRIFKPKTREITLDTFFLENESNIKKITERFDELAQQIKSNLGLVEIASGSSSSSVFRETSSVVDESFSICGREDDKRKIIELLLKEESTNKFSVIPIVGMGGVGKTTLAQWVYNDNRVQNHFNLKAWVCVSDTFDIKRITKVILESVTSTPCQFDDLNSLQVRVNDALKGKRFLIVLDDVWNENYGDWDNLQKPFGVGAAGSAILVTTRDRKVASTMGAVDHYNLNQLSEDDCWNMFVQHAFGIRSSEASHVLVKIGKDIAKKCNGLPLAAKSLGGLLRSKEKFEWENVLNSNIWDLPEEENDILPVLKLSYNHLPSQLKRCFVYCSIFPKDYEFEEEMVVLLWMAEGFLQQPNRNMKLEDFGHKCFRQLLSMSFFQPSSSTNGCFVMHDLMSDLAVWAAGKTCFRLETLSDERPIFNKARHSSYISDQKFEAFNGVDRLRTFLPLNITNYFFDLPHHVTFDLLPKLKFLRVLSLAGYCITELPNSIGDLKHLRYLDLSNTSIESLPESVSTMCNLQTLLLNNCSRLKKLPTDLQNLISLRYLDISKISLIQELPPRIGRLTSLRKLSDFIVGKDSGSGIGELMNLKHLKGTLRISKLENVIDAQQARKANLGDKKGLNGLKLKWRSVFDERRNEMVEKEVLDKLRPHDTLKKLSIRGYGGVSFPTWLGDSSFSNMVLLKLEDCEKCTDLPALGQLPLLKDLCIKRMKGIVTVDPGFDGEGGFPSLERLWFHDMGEWRDWFPCDVAKHNSFERLREFSIMNCPNMLGKLPNHLPSLEKLEFRECERLMVSISSFPKLYDVEIGGDCHNDSVETISYVSRLDVWPHNIMTIGRVSADTFTKELIERSKRVEYLKILYCDELVSLCKKELSLQHLTLLRSLEIQRCENLENLIGLQKLTSLTKLRIEMCPKLVSFPKRILPAMLRRLEIIDCNALESVSEAISWHYYRNNSSLEYLSIERCDSLTSIARALLLSTVKELKIGYCQSLESVVKELPTTLKNLEISECPKLGSTSRRSLLESLSIRECPSLEFLFSSSREELPSSLKNIEIRKCPKLGSIGESLPNNSSLELIRIQNCESLVRFPDGGSPAANLRKLEIYNCEKLEAMPNRMHDFTSLHEFDIWRCPAIVSFPEQGLPTNITRLSIQNPIICMKMLEWGLHRLASLRELSIDDLNMVTFPPSEEMVLPSSLIQPNISDFPNLETLSSKGFQNLTSLERLSIKNCPKIQSLPLFPSLKDLSTFNCPLLKQECAI